MIYLKLFDSYDQYYKDRDEYFDGYLKKLNGDLKKSKERQEEYKKNDHLYYTLLDGDEKGEELLKTVIDLTDGDISRILGKFTSKYIPSVDKWTDEYNTDVIYITAHREKNTLIEIWRLPDEWYLVKVGDYKKRGYIFEKCDQIEGLEYLLNKMLLK
jgi:hypothetical protein